MSIQGAKKPTERDWLTQKPTLKRLWLDDSRKLMGKDGVKEIMETQHDFSAPKWQYEKHFRDWKWSKNRNKDEWEQLAIAMHERKRQGKETNVYIRGELQSRDKIRKEISRYCPSINDRLSFASTQQISKNITVRTPVLDRTDSLTVGLPFRHLENHLQLGFHRQGLQNMSWPNFSTGSPFIDPRPTFYEADAEDPCLSGTVDFNAELESFRQQQSYEASKTILGTSNTWIPNGSMFTAWKSVDPRSIENEGFPSSSVRSTSTLAFASPLYRQVLFSVANNFAGLDGSLTDDLIWLLTKNKFGNLYHMVRSAQSYSSRAIIQGLFKVAIEAGDANFVDMLIHDNPRDIKINEQFFFVEGETYTPIERATHLRHEDVVKCLVEHGADVNRTAPESLHPDFRRGLGGALHHAVGHLKYDHDGSQIRVETHPKIFQYLLNAGGDLSSLEILSLIDLGEVEPVVLLMSVNTRKNAAEWSEWGIFSSMIEGADEHISLDIVKIMLEYGADINYEPSKGRVPPTWREKTYGKRKFSSRTMINVAAQRGYLCVVKLLLDSGAFINGHTLPCALASGNQDLVNLLLVRGADANSCGSGGITPLAAAIQCEVAQVLSLIEDHGISARMREQDFSDLFQAASGSANIPLTTQLIRHGCNVSLEDFDFALLTATKERRTKAAKILIDAGANVNITFGDLFEYPLIEALRERNETLVMSLLDADADSKLANVVPIVQAAQWGNRSVIKNLIFAGADVNHIQGEGSTNHDVGTALNIAVKRQDYELVQFLLASGADINNPKPQELPPFRGFENTALATAAQNGDFEMARFLLGQGADPNDSAALLHATLKDEKIVDLLFERHSARYPTSTRSFGADALAKAIDGGNERNIKLMIAKKVNANVMMSMGMGTQEASPFGVAISRQPEVFTGCLELFLQNGCHPDTLVSGNRVSGGRGDVTSRVTGFLAAIGTRNISTVELFISHGADVNLPTPGPVKRTPSQKAAEVGSLEILKLLFNHGANINAPPARRGGGTALQFAAINGHIRIAGWLLSQGADVNEPGSVVNGRTALEGAAEHGRLDMVQLLLNAGAGSRQGDDIQVANAIELARSNWHYPICDLLGDYFSSRRRGSGMMFLPDGIIPDLNLDEDFSDLVNFDLCEGHEVPW